MAKQRYAQFFRNSSIVTYQDYATAKAEIILAFEANKTNLKDGEFILGRYAFPNTGEEADRKHGVVVGVARRNGNTVNLDFLADEIYVDYRISENLNTLNTPASTVGTLATSASISTVTLYNVSQSNGKVSVGTTSDTLDIAMAGQYNASTNKVALESTVSGAISGISSSEKILQKSNDGTVYTFGTLLTQTNGVNTITGSESLTFQSAPNSNNPIVTMAELTGVTGPMYYKGTVSSNQDLPTASTAGVSPGWVYLVSANGTYAGQACEVGDMIVVSDVTANEVKFDIISGENQYEFNDVAVSVGGGLTTIGTIDGAALKISVTDSYSTLVGTADADEVQSPISATGQINVLNRVEEANGVISPVTAYTLSTVASTGAAVDVSFGTNAMTSKNVQTAIEELLGKITDSNLTIDTYKGAIKSDPNTMIPVASDNGTIGVRTDNVYIGSGNTGITLLHVDTDGSSVIGSDLATVNTVDGHIKALDGTVDAASVSTSLTATGQVDVLTAVQQIDGVVTTGTKVTLSTVATSGTAYDVSVDYERIGIVSTNVEDAIAELIGNINNVAGNVVDGGNGVTVSTNTIGSSVISTVSLDLAEKAHEFGSTSYNTNADNLLLIGSDGKLTIEDTWDCGTY